MDLAGKEVTTVKVVAMKLIGLTSLLEMGLVWSMEDCNHENVVKVTPVEWSTQVGVENVA